MTYPELKKKCLERFFSRSNPQQKEAIFKIDGSVLIIAGAGSGKTTVLCNRIANMLLFGSAYNSNHEPQLGSSDLAFLEDYASGKLDNNEETISRLSETIGYERVIPWQVLVVTFTNKAAGELKERLNNMSAHAEDVWAMTFHSACVRILRRGITSLGYKTSFTIYDSDDSLRVIKDSMKALNISDKTFPYKQVQNAISHAKDKLQKPAQFEVMTSGKKDFRLETYKQIYSEYQKRLKSANALDFDDIIMLTVELFETDKEVLSYWQNHFRYIMVDEYQDTNKAQYRLVSLLAQKYGNLCVVGDEDQSIYRFRGATIQNILSFEDEFNSKVVKLEQNYRSTESILNAANAVIANNTQRKDKSLWSDLGKGDRIQNHRFSDEQSEGLFVANSVLDHIKSGGKYSDNAVLYRTNAQSRTIELAMARLGVPYKIVGGVRFYERKEIKDIIAYMSVIANPFDLVRFSRIVNEPKRNIGDATQAEILRISEGLAINPVEVMERSAEFGSLAKKAKTLTQTATIFNELIGNNDPNDPDYPLETLVASIVALSGYDDMLVAMGDEGAVRRENINELKSSVITFCEENESHSLTDFLEQVALIADIDSYDSGDDKVVMMTMHAAKGLEFDTVYLVGAEENIFPSFRSLADPEEIEEERRLAYVAITRAKRILHITSAKQRLLYGQTMMNRVSRFVREIPAQYIETDDRTKSAPSRTISEKKDSGYLQQNRSQTKLNPSAQTVTYSAGERVNHKIFGDGTVVSCKPTGGDTLLEIAFDKVGTKRIMANFAKVTKLGE